MSLTPLWHHRGKYVTSCQQSPGIPGIPGIPGRAWFCGVLLQSKGRGFLKSSLGILTLTPGRAWDSFLCLPKDPLLRLKSLLPEVPERQSLGMPHEATPTCALPVLTSGFRLLGALSVQGRGVPSVLTQVPHLDFWRALSFLFLST